MAQRNDDDFEDYVASSRRTLVRSAYLLCGNWHDAEDVVQIALTKLYRVWPRMRSDTGSPDAYVRRIVRNPFVDDWRRPWRRWEKAAAEPLENAEVLAEACSAQGMFLRSALMQLPMRQRQVIVWRFYWGFSQAETAAELGITLGTVKSHSTRALTHLHRLIEPETAA